MGLLSGGGNAAYKSLERTNFVATAGQTTFTLTQGYSVGDIDIFLNGIKLQEGDDYYATNGTTVVLNAAAAVGDFLQVVSYNQFGVAGTYTKEESDGRYMTSTGVTPMSAYLKTPNYGITSGSDSQSASLEANPLLGTQGTGIKAWGRNMATYGGDIHYISDMRGTSGAHRFYGWNGSSWIENAKLDAGGRLILANQPSIYLDGNSSTVTFTAGQVVNYLTPVHTYGGMVWDSASGRVTVPVAGRYVISYITYHYHAGACRTTIRHNGSIYALVHSNNAAQDDGSRGNTTIRNMAAGDYIQLYVEYAGAYYMGSQHTYMSIHLLG